MKSDSLPVEIQLPALSDEAVIEIRDFLTNLTLLFTKQYHAQISRYYQDHEYNSVHQSKFFADPPDDNQF
jgi:hypothetical protein